MLMFEARSIIGDIEAMKQTMKSFEAEPLGHYLFWDSIFVPKDKGEKIDLNLRTIRLRVMDMSAQRSKKAMVTEKTTLWFPTYKQDTIVIQKTFDSEPEAHKFVADHYRRESLKVGPKYFREGWQYKLGDCRLFIEKIMVPNLVPSFPPTIKIQAETEKGLAVCCTRLGIRDFIPCSVPEMVRQRLDEVYHKPKG